MPTLTLAQPHVERPRPRFATLDTFVVGERESARLALESARAALEEPGSMSPLLIYGPTGVGKTHLLEGIWSAAQRNRGLGTALFLTAEQFTTQFVSALRGTGLPNFRRKYRGVGLLIIDDIQFFAGKQSTLTELLHTLNKLMHEGRQIVLSADRTPAELGDLGRDLVNRLQSGMICRLEPLDYAARLGMVEQLCLKHNMEVSPKVQQFIAASLVGHSRELTGALNRLRVTSRARREPITLELAQSALAEMIRYSTPVVRLPDIERAVCDVFGIERDSLHSNRRAKAVAYPRMLAMWLARKHTRAALSEIGHYFGRRSHTTVLSAQKKVEGWMSTSAHLALADRNWSIEEAVWSIEAQLHAS